MGDFPESQIELISKKRTLCPSCWRASWRRRTQAPSCLRRRDGPLEKSNLIKTTDFPLFSTFLGRLNLYREDRVDEVAESGVHEDVFVGQSHSWNQKYV